MNAPFPQPGKPALRLLLAAPRGFCAGVDRAIEIVERALTRYGAPVYVRHEIVHNRFVVDGLRDKGAIFVEELDEVPDGAPVVFSAHGVPKSVPANATERGLDWLDATCPLVSKVHRQAERQIEAGRHILFIGHKGHPEVIGTFGQVPEGTITLVETLEDVAGLDFPADAALSFLTQTTLSVDDTAEIVAALRARYPGIAGPKAEDICYATSNRQAAVKAIAEEWFLRQMENKSDGHKARARRLLEKDLYPSLGHFAIDAITPIEVLAALRKIESRSVDLAHRAKQTCSLIFKYAIITSRLISDPAQSLAGALKTAQTVHRAAIIDPQELRDLLRAIDEYVGRPIVCAALKLSPILFQRPGEVRHDERPAALPQKVHGSFGVVRFYCSIVQRRATKNIDAVEGEAVLVQEPQDFRPPVGRRPSR